MEFQPPDPADLANVHSLNREFLDGLSNRSSRFVAKTPFAAEIAATLARLAPAARSRLAHSPFLIFCLAEDDESRWRRLFDRTAEDDMIRGLDRPDVAEMRLVAATLGFLWQQATRSRYAARVVSGAPPGWCERLADSTFVEVLRNATNEAGLLRLRCQDDASFWQKLIKAGTSDEAAVRRAARLSALQTLLTLDHSSNYHRLPAAACRMPKPPRRVADTADVSQRRMRGYNTPPDASAEDKRSVEDLPKR